MIRRYTEKMIGWVVAALIGVVVFVIPNMIEVQQTKASDQIIDSCITHTITRQGVTYTPDACK